MADIPHFRFPFQRSSGTKVDVVEQHTEDHIRNSAEVLLRCPLDFRLDRPEYGWSFPTFRPWPIDTSDLEAALARWAHPGATYQAEDWTDAAGSAARQVTAMIQYARGVFDGG